MGTMPIPASFELFTNKLINLFGNFHEKKGKINLQEVSKRDFTLSDPYQSAGTGCQSLSALFPRKGPASAAEVGPSLPSRGQGVNPYL